MVVTSAGVISRLTAQLLQVSREQWLTLVPRWVNGSVTHLRVTDGQPELVSHNDVTHLAGALVTTR